MKSIFIWMLKKYASTEKGRIEIMRIMNDKVINDYIEQTSYGNVYNYFIEFIMANPFIVKCVSTKDEKSLRMLKNGIEGAFNRAIDYIKNDGFIEKL